MPGKISLGASEGGSEEHLQQLGGEAARSWLKLSAPVQRGPAKLQGVGTSQQDHRMQ